MSTEAIQNWNKNPIGIKFGIEALRKNQKTNDEIYGFNIYINYADNKNKFDLKNGSYSTVSSKEISYGNEVYSYIGILSKNKHHIRSGFGLGYSSSNFFDIKYSSPTDSGKLPYINHGKYYFFLGFDYVYDKKYFIEIRKHFRLGNRNSSNDYYSLTKYDPIVFSISYGF